MLMFRHLLTVWPSGWRPIVHQKWRKYFQDKNLSPAEVKKALEDEKYTAIEIQTVMNGISFKTA